MYGMNTVGPAGGAAATGTLAATGLNGLAMVVGALTLIAAGLSVIKLARVRRRDH
ncbi:hypothetical protein [Streptomyces sp. CA-111067]|uniref:hypothetical protein n=1 Tax=Streptomyces sp. CA-111067 TaxID=3240046 RepID=UPI003D97C3F6